MKHCLNYMYTLYLLTIMLSTELWSVCKMSDLPIPRNISWTASQVLIFVYLHLYSCRPTEYSVSDFAMVTEQNYGTEKETAEFTITIALGRYFVLWMCKLNRCINAFDCDIDLWSTARTYSVNITVLPQYSARLFMRVDYSLL